MGDYFSPISGILHLSASTHYTFPPICTCAFVPTHPRSKSSGCSVHFSSFQLAPAATIILLLHLHITLALEKTLKEFAEYSVQVRTIRTTRIRHAWSSWSATWQWQMMGSTRHTLKCIQTVRFFIFIFWSCCIFQGQPENQEKPFTYIHISSYRGLLKIN